MPSLSLNSIERFALLGILLDLNPNLESDSYVTLVKCSLNTLNFKSHRCTD